MKFSKLTCKIFAFLLVLTMATTSLPISRVVHARSYEDFLFELFISEDSNFEDLEFDVEEFVASFSLLQYSGESRIINNVKFIYENGQLSGVVDAHDNSFSFVHGTDIHLSEIHFGNNVVDVEINEHGLVSYGVRGTGIGTHYERNEAGQITQISSGNMEINISADSQDVVINDIFSLPSFDVNQTGAMVEATQMLNIPTSNLFSTIEELDNNGSMIRAIFSVDDYDRISTVEYSNNMTLRASYDEHGFSSSVLEIGRRSGEILSLETSVKPVITQVGELNRLDGIIYNSNDNVDKHVMNDYGLIGAIYRDGVLAIEFTYDQLTSQLISVHDHVLNITSTYRYDYYGNIVSRTIYTSNGVETFVYEYNNPNWRDQLTSFNGTPIVYDEFGNMTSGLGLHLYWRNGNLVRVENDRASAYFTYNQYNRRTSMTIDGVTTNFLMDDSGRILAEYSSDGQTIAYQFDHENNLLGFILNGEQYFYQTNFFGDIIGILDNNLYLVVEYVYDTWGNILEIRGEKANTVGRINPFRYRGHRYDEATGLYYIYGRFYNPVLGRFISPGQDLGIVGNSISHNLYAFALNNPVMNGYEISPLGLTLTKMIPFLFVWITFAFVLMMWYQPWQLEWALWDIGFEANRLAQEIGSAAIWFGQVIGEMLQATMQAFMHTSIRSPWHIHHIVAQAAPAAATSRRIFEMYFGWGSVQSHSLNLVAVRASLHARLHTNLYHQWVENLLRIAVNHNLNNTTTWGFATLITTMNGIANILHRASIAAP